MNSVCVLLVNLRHTTKSSKIDHLENIFFLCADADMKQSLLCELFLRIAHDFPGDVGCWSIYFMNYVTLQEGESMFLGPNVPHAYLYGGKSCLPDF